MVLMIRGAISVSPQCEDILSAHAAIVAMEKERGADVVHMAVALRGAELAEAET